MPNSVCITPCSVRFQSVLNFGTMRRILSALPPLVSNFSSLNFEAICRILSALHPLQLSISECAQFQANVPNFACITSSLVLNFRVCSILGLFAKCCLHTLSVIFNFRLCSILGSFPKFCLHTPSVIQNFRLCSILGSFAKFCLHHNLCSIQFQSVLNSGAICQILSATYPLPAFVVTLILCQN